MTANGGGGNQTSPEHPNPAPHGGFKKMRIFFWVAFWLLTLGAARIYVVYSDVLIIDLKGWLE